MPRLHQNSEGEFYIIQNSSAGGPDPRFTSYSVSRDGLRLLLEFGISDGASIPHEVFHRLRTAGHIRSGVSHRFDPADASNQRIAHKRIEEFFSRYAHGPASALEFIQAFKADVLLTLATIKDEFLKQQMYLHVAERLHSCKYADSAKNLLIDRTPRQWRGEVSLALGEDPEIYEDEAFVTDSTKSEEGQSKAPVQTPSEDDEVIELPNIDHLPHEVRSWLFNAYATFPGVKMSESKDPTTGEIRVCFEGLPQGLAEALAKSLLQTVPGKKRKRRKKIRFRKDRTERSFGLNVPIGGQPGWRRRIKRP
jgi:hypothetical protein